MLRETFCPFSVHFLTLNPDSETSFVYILLKMEDDGNRYERMVDRQSTLNP